MVGQIRQKLEPDDGKTGLECPEFLTRVQRLPVHLAGVHHQPQEAIPCGGVSEQFDLSLNRSHQEQGFLRLVAAERFDKILRPKLIAGGAPRHQGASNLERGEIEALCQVVNVNIDSEFHAVTK